MMKKVKDYCLTVEIYVMESQVEKAKGLRGDGLEAGQDPFGY